MTPDPNMTKSTPLNPAPPRPPDTEPQPEGDDDADSERIRPAASQPPNPATHTDPPTPPTTGHSAAQGLAHERLGELAETYRVLTELAQQLTNAMQHVAHRHSYYPLEVREALDAAAELGITPTPQP